MNPILTATVCLSGFGTLLAASAHAAAKPNILWLVAEDFGPHLGCYGTREVSTPNLDRLAAEGVRYTRFYNGMVCSVSRSSFMTGMHATTIGAHNHRTANKQPLPEGVRTLSQWMRSAGYFTANLRQLPASCGFKGTGKTDWNFKVEGPAFDSDRWADLKPHQPFYAQINFSEAHRPFKAPQKADPAKVEIPPYYPDHPVTREDWAKYLDEATALDAKVGRVLTALEQDGLADDTIVVFFGDNGQSNVRGKQFIYEEGQLVPLIIRWPRNFPAPADHKPGTVDDRLHHGIDLAPTMLALAGAPKPPKMEGRIFLGERTEPDQTYVFGYRDRCDMTQMRLRSVRDSRYRYIRNFTPWVPFLARNEYKQSQYPVWNLLRELHAQGKLTPPQEFLCQPTMPEEELYDMQNDPWQIHNLAGSAKPDDQAALKRLRSALEKWIADTGDKGQRLETLEELKSSEPRFNPALDWRPEPETKEAAEAARPRAGSSDSTAAPVPPNQKREKQAGKPSKGSQDEGFPAMRKQWDTPSPPAKPAGDARIEAAFQLAEKHSRQANEAFYRSRRFVDGWLAHADPATRLIPRNLKESRDFWNGRDSAADNWPFMVLTAAMTDRPLFESRMLEMLRTETRLTCRVDRLPDDYSFSKKGWRRERIELDAIIFDGAEYVKDGLLPITEWLGKSPWSDRAIGIVDDIWKNAAIETPSGRIPTLNFEVNGDLLQACSRLFWFTGERKYLDWAIRLGDYYLCGTHHPTRDMKELNLGDHSCEVINGPSELYVACAHAAPERREAYRKPLHEMYDRILAIACNEHGMIHLNVDTRTGKPLSTALTDNWGYNYDGLYTVFLLDGNPAYRDAVRNALGNLKAHYSGKGGMCQSGTADGYADSIEGALTLLNREPIPSAMDWVDSEIKTMWSRQDPDGVIEGWHGDGNSARTSLMYALWKTQGITIEPWRADVRFGTANEGGALCISLTADEPWQGRLIFDRQRHKANMRLPLDYPRINQFPEWFVAEPAANYQLKDIRSGETSDLAGKRLIEGVKLEIPSGAEARLILRRR